MTDHGRDHERRHRLRQSVREKSRGRASLSMATCGTEGWIDGAASRKWLFFDGYVRTTTANSRFIYSSVRNVRETRTFAKSSYPDLTNVAIKCQWLAVMSLCYRGIILQLEYLFERRKIFYSSWW